MILKQIYDPSLSQYAYLIGCGEAGEALIIDPQRDIDRYLEIAGEEDIKIRAVAETHIHADFLAGTREFLEQQEKVQAYLSDEGGEDWKYEWAKGRGDVRFLKNGDSFSIGTIKISSLHTPGHTPEHLSYLIEDKSVGTREAMAVVTGDFVFVGDLGHPDLLETAAGESNSQETSARELFRSIRPFIQLQDFTMVLPGHGSGSSCGKSPGSIPFSTVGYERRYNKTLRTGREKGEEAFVEQILEAQPEPPLYFARMKQNNKNGPSILGKLPQPNRFTPSETLTLLEDKPENIVVVDTRSDREDFMKSHLTGSLYAPRGPKFSEAVGSYVEPDKTIFLVIENESQAEDCVRELIRIGIDSVGGYLLLEDLKSTEVELPTTRTHTISIEEVDPDDTVLDVRGEDEWEESHIPGSSQLAHTRLVADSYGLPQSGSLTVHCASGMRAALASAQLERSGYEVTYANGPFSAWKDAH